MWTNVTVIISASSRNKDRESSATHHHFSKGFHQGLMRKIVGKARDLRKNISKMQVLRVTLSESRRIQINPIDILGFTLSTRKSPVTTVGHQKC